MWQNISYLYRTFATNGWRKHGERDGRHFSDFKGVQETLRGLTVSWNERTWWIFYGSFAWVISRLFIVLYSVWIVCICMYVCTYVPMDGCVLCGAVDARTSVGLTRQVLTIYETISREANALNGLDRPFLVDRNQFQSEPVVVVPFLSHRPHPPLLIWSRNSNFQLWIEVIKLFRGLPFVRVGLRKKYISRESRKSKQASKQASERVFMRASMVMICPGNLLIKLWFILWLPINFKDHDNEYGGEGDGQSKMLFEMVLHHFLVVRMWCPPSSVQSSMFVLAHGRLF